MLDAGVMKMNDLIPTYEELKTSDERFKQNFNIVNVE